MRNMIEMVMRLSGVGKLIHSNALVNGMNAHIQVGDKKYQAVITPIPSTTLPNGYVAPEVYEAKMAIIECCEKEVQYLKKELRLMYEKQQTVQEAEKYLKDK